LQRAKQLKAIEHAMLDEELPEARALGGGQLG
jgi:hypothetical protein